MPVASERLNRHNQLTLLWCYEFKKKINVGCRILYTRDDDDKMEITSQTSS